MAKPKIKASCHPDRWHHARGLCNACYMRSNECGVRATCHPNKPHCALGLCRACYAKTPESKASKKAWQDSHKKEQSDYIFEWNLNRKYGLTVQQHAEMLEAQDGVCAGCRMACDVHSRLSTDHDHNTNLVRGLLCNRCNRAIGQLRSDPDTLRRLASYLEKAQATNSLFDGLEPEYVSDPGFYSRFGFVVF